MQRSLVESSPGIVVALALCAVCAPACAPGAEPGRSGADVRFEVVEVSIADIHAAMLQGRLTARDLVQAYLERIEAYDRRGPYLNALVTVNPRALERAGELDAALAAGGELVGPLHGIPVIVKDNYDTADLPTTAGSAALAGSIPPDDAFQVQRIREAGAIVLAKSNMAEFAFSPYETVGSAIPGYTRNPYDIRRVTAGSSGGTAAAVAASLGAVGLGTDTGNSIRGPSSHNLLVGIRSTMGLTSRDGIVPLYLDHDIGGPMARTVADAVRVLDVIAGPDPADPITAAAAGEGEDGTPRRAPSYLDFLVEDALAGARLGVVRQLSDTETTDEEIHALFEQALADLRAAGAEVVDVQIRELDEIPRDRRWCPRFKFDLEAYLETRGERAPFRTLEEIIASGRTHSSIAGALRRFAAVQEPPDTNDLCREAAANGRRLAAGVRAVMESARLDALVYPTWSNPPRPIGDLGSPAGDNSQDLSPHTGFPAITVPMGLVHTADPQMALPAYAGPGLPAGITFLSTSWQEPRLIELAYSYEQATGHRVPPATTPALLHGE